MPIEKNAKSTRRFGKKTKILFFVFSVALFSALGVRFFSEPGPPSEAFEGDFSSKEQPDAVLEGVRLITSEYAVLRWELYADKAFLYQKKDSAEAQNVEVRYFRDGRVISWLRADRARIRLSSNEVQAEGNVLLISEEGARLEVQKLFWDEKKKEIYTNTPVRVYKGRDRISANGLSADPQLQVIRFFGEVRTQVRETKEWEDTLKRLQVFQDGDKP